ncbi:hypothetical protein R5W24_004252 [Gemmata sp. JC717]|uniref:hypothetical protein n=1 Tax=Gemmata algarum TaxID=2975278 RepID=UPI0021BB8E9A|nr:hypothetical protein [Gemmata algarum]MDY3555117.1 hypothetical protein [Gemmata algarum]
MERRSVPPPDLGGPEDKRRARITSVVKAHAKAGYAVSGVTTRAGLWIKSLRVTYARIQGDLLDLTDTYSSEWAGAKDAGAGVTIDTGGRFAVGIVGKTEPTQVMNIGLVHMKNAPAATAGAGKDLPAGPTASVSPDPPSVPTRPRAAETSSSAPPAPKSDSRTDHSAPIADPDRPVGAAVVAHVPARVAAEERTEKVAAAAPPTPSENPSGVLVPALVGFGVAAVAIGGCFVLGLFRRTSVSGVPVEDERAGDIPVTPTHSEGSSLPPDLLRSVSAELTRGEAIVWCGQPSARLTRLKAIQTAIGFGFGTLILAAGLLFVLGRSNGPGGKEAWIVLLGFGVLAAVFLAGIVLGSRMVYRKAARTAYVITNRRAIVWHPPLFGEGMAESYTPAQLQQMRRRDSWFAPNAGDLIFRTETHVDVTHHSGGRSGNNSYGSSTSYRTRIVRFGFLGVDDVREIEKMIRAALVDPLVDKMVGA